MIGGDPAGRRSRPTRRFSPRRQLRPGLSAGGCGSKADRRRQPFELLDVRPLRCQAREARPDHGPAFADPAEKRLELGDRRPARLRHAHRHLTQDVAVERDVDAVDAVEHGLRIVVDPDFRDVLDLGRIEGCAHRRVRRAAR